MKIILSILSVFIFSIVAHSQGVEMLNLKGNFFVRETSEKTDTIKTKVGIDIAIQNNKGLLVVHGLDDFGADTLMKFTGITVVDQMKTTVSKGYAEEGYTFMNNYNITFNASEKVQKAYVSYDPVLNAYRVLISKGDTTYSVHSDDIYFTNWSRRRLHERVFDLKGFDVYERSEEGFKKSGESDLDGRILLGDENVTINLGSNTENVPIWYKARAKGVFMYVGDSQEFRIDNVRKEIVYLTQLKDNVYQRMYVFRMVGE